MAKAPRFVNSDEVRSWLEGQTIETAQVFAARAALRAIPFLPGQISGGSASRAQVGSLILLSFRAASAAWATTAFPAQKDKLGEMSAAAVVALDTLVPFKTAASEATKSAALSSSVTSAARSKFACATALSAAQRASGSSGSSILQAASFDTLFLKSDPSPMNLARSAIWPEFRKELFTPKTSWIKLAGELRSLGENWEIWINWYDAVADGRWVDEALELKRCNIPEELWGRGPKSVNPYIKLLVDRHSPAEPPVPEGPGPNLIPTPTGFELSPIPPSFVERQNPTQRSLHSQLLRRVERVDSQLPRIQNTHKSLYNEFVDYGNFITENIEDLDVPSLWSIGAALSDMVEALSKLENSPSPRGSMVEAIEPDILSELRSLCRDHTTFIMGFKEAQELAARAAALRILDIDRKEIRDRTLHVLEPMLVAKSLLAQHAATLVRGINRALEVADDTTYAFLGASVATATRSIVAFGRAIAPLVGPAAVVSSLTGLNFSMLTGDPNAEAIRAAATYLMHNGNNLLAFAAHDAQFKVWLGWLLGEIQKAARQTDKDEAASV